MILLPQRQSEVQPSAPPRPTTPRLITPPPTTPRLVPPGRVLRWGFLLLLIVCVAWLFVACGARDNSVESYLGITVPEATITEHVEQRRQELGIAGLTVAIVNDGEVVYAETFGHADVEADLPVTDETIFEGASLSKPVFAQFVMTFVEQGVLDLDRPLHEYLPHPDIVGDERAERITARMVLSHQSGFPNWRADEPDGVLRIKFEPGTDYEYSGEGYHYLATVLLEIAGTDWVGLEELFQERIAEPLGLERTVFMQNQVTRRHKAEPYGEDGRKIHWRSELRSADESEPVDDEFVAAASVHTDAADFSRWMIAVMNRELLTAESYEELLAPHSSPPAEELELSYTLGFYRPHIPFTDLYGHNGNNDGFTSSFMLDAEDDWGFVLFSNSEYGQEFGEELMLYLFTGPSMPTFVATVAAVGILALSPLVAGLGGLRRWRRRRSARRSDASVAIDTPALSAS